MGKLQSPIALATSGPHAATVKALPPLVFDYRATPLSMINNGWSIQFDCEAGSSVADGGTPYGLLQFHFHSPSEHTLDGRSFPLEMHLVHAGADGEPALVVGVFVREGAANRTLANAFSKLPRAEGGRLAPAGEIVRVGSLHPSSLGYFSYDGSLTTLACTEGIQWRVLRTPIEMSKAQIGAYRALPRFGQTNRPLQPIGGRTVWLAAVEQSVGATVKSPPARRRALRRRP